MTQEETLFNLNKMSANQQLKWKLKLLWLKTKYNKFKQFPVPYIVKSHLVKVNYVAQIEHYYLKKLKLHMNPLKAFSLC